jgi:hypothetical protein
MRTSLPSSRLPLHRLFWIGPLMICNCASARVEAVRDPTFHDRITRLFVVIVDHESNDADLMKASIHGLLTINRIDHRVVAISGPSEAPHVDAAIGAFAPQAILRIVPTAAILTPRGVRHEIRYDASLFPAGDDQRRIWRALLVHRAGSLVDPDEAGIPHRMDLVTRKLVDKLIADGVIGPS